MNPIFSFSDEYERHMTVAAKEGAIGMMEAAMMADQISQQLRINVALSELKVMQENGTASDLAELIIEAGEVAAQQAVAAPATTQPTAAQPAVQGQQPAQPQQEEGGLLYKVFTSIGKFFSGIFNAIASIFNGKNSARYKQLVQQNADITVDANAATLVNACNEATQKLEEAGKNPINAFKVIGGIVFGGGALAATYGIYQKTKGKFNEEAQEGQTTVVKAGVVKQWLDVLQNGSKKIQELFLTTAGNLKNAFTAKRQEALNKKANKQENKELNKQLTDSQNALNAAQAKVNSLKKSGAPQDQIQAAEEELQDLWNQQGQQFIGAYSMVLEAGEEGEYSFNIIKPVVDFVMKLISFASNMLKGGLDKVLNGAQVAGNTVAAAAGAAQQAMQPKPQGVFGKIKNAVTGQNFVGDNYEESTSSDIDPIDAMLSGLAFGTQNG